MEEDKLPEVGLVPNSCCVMKNLHFLIASLCNYNNFKWMKGPFRESVMKRESTILYSRTRRFSYWPYHFVLSEKRMSNFIINWVI